jgi:hypothetical protein
LRAKLREYYASEGKSDEVVIGIPKGHYALQFTRRDPERPEGSAAEIRPAENGFEMALAPEPHRMAGRLALAVVAISAFAAGITAAWLWPKSHSSTPGAARQDELVSFWRSFAGADHTVLVTFANVEMLHTDSGDLLKFEGGAVDDRGAKVERDVAAASVASPGLLGRHSFFYEDGYSGTGEVQAMYHLTRLMAAAGIDMQVKRSRLVTSDDLRSHNVLLLGAGRENIAVDELHLKQGYVFETPRYIMWSNTIHDIKGVLPGGRTSYAVERDSKGALKTDYALFSVMPGLAPNRRIMMLAGLTTSGTQGAGEFATSEGQLAGLLAQMSAATGKRLSALPTYFESILEVRVVRGLDPISVRCVAARPISPGVEP